VPELEGSPRLAILPGRSRARRGPFAAPKSACPSRPSPRLRQTRLRPWRKLRLQRSVSCRGQSSNTACAGESSSGCADGSYGFARMRRTLSRSLPAHRVDQRADRAFAFDQLAQKPMTRTILTAATSTKSKSGAATGCGS